MIAPVLSAAAARVGVPWKNKGGVTRTIATGPADAGMDEFDWRLSMAEVAAAGPFSCFAGVDRVLAAIEGRLSLTIDGVEHRIGPADAPVAFAGDVATSGVPLDGTMVDLNLMLRRGRCTGDLWHWTPGRRPRAAARTVVLVFTAPGSVGHKGIYLYPTRFDAIRLVPEDWDAVTIASDGAILVAEIGPCP